MMLPTLPAEAAPLRLALPPAFPRPTGHRFLLLRTAATLATGRRTVANLLRTAGPFAEGHPTRWKRVGSTASWSGLRLACLLAGFALRHLVPDGRVTPVGDDPVASRPGRRAYGKARHRDPVRSRHADTAWRYGPKGASWRSSSASRSPPAPGPCPCWSAFPVRSGQPGPPTAAAHPGPAPVPAVAGGAAEVPPPHVPGRRRCRLRDPCGRPVRLPPPRPAGVGPQAPPRREPVRPAPAVRRLGPAARPGRPAAAPAPGGGCPKAPLPPADGGWYGGGTRRVRSADGTGHGHQAGKGLVPPRGVLVRDADGTHRDEYFFTTDLTRTPAAVIGHDAGRWDSETTFAELRAHLGRETPRGRCPKTVLRAAPCLFGLVYGRRRLVPGAAGGTARRSPRSSSE